MQGFLRLRLRTIILITIASAMLAAVAYWKFPSTRLIAGRLESETPAVGSENIARHLQQLRQLGKDGLQSLVRSMSSNRADISEGAATAIESELEEWRSLPVDASSVLVSTLAELLALHADSYPPPARRRAAQIASQILLWPIDRNVIDGSRLVDDCGTVLEASFHVAENPAVEAAISDLEELATENNFDEPAAVSPSPTPIQDRLPGGISEISPPPQEFGSDENLPILPYPVSSAEPNPFPVSEPTDDTAADEPAPQLYRSPAPTRVLEQEAPRPPAHTPVAVLRKPPALDKLADLDVMRELHSASDAVSFAAAEELKGRGYRDIDIKLARHLVDPDPQVRLKLVGALPSIAGVDPRPWLLHLMKDSSVEVRRAAASVLATSSDPEIRRRLEELELEETDPEVLRQVRRALSPASR